MTASGTAPSAPTEVEAPPDAEPPVAAEPPTTGSSVAQLAGRYWATIALVALILLAGLFTGALWNDVETGSSLYDQVAYGLPALHDGKVQTFLLGMFFSPQLVLYVPILALLVLVASAYERRVGHVRTLVVAIGGQFLAALVTAVLLWTVEGSGWTWAVELGKVRDLGISAGGFALLGALSAVMGSVWRRRVRVAVGFYLFAMVLNSGLIWDVEHFLGFLIGGLAGPFLAGRAPNRPKLSWGRRTQRTLVALVIAVSAISGIVEAVYSGNGGPFRSAGQAMQESGVTLSFVISAIFVLLLADSLRRGRRLAWIVTTAILGLSFLSLWAVEPSSERTADLVLTGLQTLLLLVTFRAFTARAQRRAFRHAGRRLLVVAAALLVYTVAGFAVMADEFTPNATWSDALVEWLNRLVFTTSGEIEPTTTAATWFITSIGAVWLTVILVTIVGLLYSSRRPVPPPDADDRLHGLLRTHRSSNIAWMLTWRGITTWFSSDGATVIGYEVVGSVALCLADPVGPPERRAAALAEFDAFCFDRGWIPCLFAADQASADIAPSIGWKAVEVAEDSVLVLDGLEFKGKAFQDVRTAINKAGKQEVTLELTRWEESKPVVRDQLRAISQGWVGDKALPEMGFTLGTLREADDPEVRLHLAVDPDRTIEGFTSWLPVYDDGQVVGWTLDLMRRRESGFRPVMEFLIGTSAMQFKEEGYAFASLSAAPLAKAPDATAAGDQRALQRLLDFLGSTLEPYYGFKSLFAFKQKFKPEHHPMYLVFPDSTALGEIGIAVARAYMPDAGLWDWARTGWEMLLPHKEVQPHD